MDQRERLIRMLDSRGKSIQCGSDILTVPPRILYLYYLKNPPKLFCVYTGGEVRWKALLLFPFRFLPFILAALIGFIIKAEAIM